MSQVLISITEEEVLKQLKENDPNIQILIKQLIFKDEVYIKSVVKELVKELVKKIEHRLLTRFKAISLLGSYNTTLYQVFVRSIDYHDTGQYSFISSKLYTSYDAAYNSVTDTSDELIEIRSYKL
jgi:hypothetical protein